MLKNILILSMLGLGIISCKTNPGSGSGGKQGPTGSDSGGKQGSISKSSCSSVIEKSKINCMLEAFGMMSCTSNIQKGLCGRLKKEVQGMGKVTEVSSCSPGYIGCCKDHTDGSIQVFYSGKVPEKSKCLKYGDVWMEP